MTGQADLVLASASPRRRELLTAMGVPFSVSSSEIDESCLAEEAATDLVQRLAKNKALAVSHLLESPDTAVLSADTIVFKDNEVFGKPGDQQQAFDTWRRLSNTDHQVATAVYLLHGDREWFECVTTDVTFVSLSEPEMQHYWDSGEPRDKAGGYAIQGLASAWVKLIHGSYSNVVGLPLREVNKLLKNINLNWL